MEIGFKGLFTFVAFIVLDFFVNNGMRLEGIGGFETFSTVTQKVFCLGVDIFVVPQLTRSQETFSTIIAVEVSFSCVNSQMNVEIRIYIEFFSTLTTSKFPFVFVPNFMVLQHISVLKTFLTDDTRVGHGRTIILVIFKTEL